LQSGQQPAQPYFIWEHDPDIANGGDLGLPRRDLVRLANSYKERGDAQRNGGAEVDQEELDAGLRQVLAEMVLPEHVEIEFARVMEIVFQPED
jgi:hypothetical protein